MMGGTRDPGVGRQGRFVDPKLQAKRDENGVWVDPDGKPNYLNYVAPICAYGERTGLDYSPRGILTCRNCGNTGLDMLSNYCGCLYGRELLAKIEQERQGAMQFTTRADTAAKIAAAVKVLDDAVKLTEDRGSTLHTPGHFGNVMADVAARLSACVVELGDRDAIAGRSTRAVTSHDLTATVYETDSGPNLCVIEYNPGKRYRQDEDVASEGDIPQRLVIRANDLEEFQQLLGHLNELRGY